MEVAIPSYRRAAVLKRKTLAFLESEGFSKESIVIFVANENERETYKTELGDSYKLVVGLPGIAAQRTFIRSYYAPGTRVLSLDDDIKGMKMLSPRPFKRVVEEMFALTEKEGLTTWGIYPVSNLFFCKERVIKGLVYIIAACYGFLCEEMTYPPYDCKEDFWMTLRRYEKDSAVLRYDGICPITTYYSDGGLSEVRTHLKEKEDAEAVCALYPAHTKIVLKRNGHWDIKLKREIQAVLQLPKLRLTGRSSLNLEELPLTLT